jgi:hypothetical protein
MEDQSRKRKSECFLDNVIDITSDSIDSSIGEQNNNNNTNNNNNNHSRYKRINNNCSNGK